MQYLLAIASIFAVASAFPHDVVTRDAPVEKMGICVDDYTGDWVARCCRYSASTQHCSQRYPDIKKCKGIEERSGCTTDYSLDEDFQDGPWTLDTYPYGFVWKDSVPLRECCRNTNNERNNWPCGKWRQFVEKCSVVQKDLDKNEHGYPGPSRISYDGEPMSR